LIGEKSAESFGLDPESIALVRFLIEEHLLLNHYASRRDYYEPRAIEFLTGRIKNQARLKMLFILTCADIQAVSDSSWTNWKDDLLRRLYHMLLAQFDKKETPSKQLSDRVEELKKLMLENGVSEALLTQLEKMPTRYLLGTPPETIVGHLKLIDEKKPHEVKLRLRTLQRPRLEAVVCCDDHPGLFSELSGVMSALNYNILSAEINTIDNTVLDIFVVEDLVSTRTEDWEQEVSSRSAKLERTLSEAIEKKLSVDELVGKKKGIFKPRTRLAIPVEVHFDQESSEHYTIIEVQSQDRTGLLYKVTRAIFEHGLDIQFAKISTRADKVFDVFYLRDPLSKGKAQDEQVAKLVKSLQVSLKSST
jgi:[protein-PII] uridylyltransferase